MYKKLIALLIFLAVAPACIHATVVSPCAASGTVASFIGTTCTIGDKTFSFTGVTSSILTSGVILTPDATNSTAPGFILTPAAGFAFSDTNGSFFLEIGYTVAITNPSSGFLITGETSMLSGATATPTSSTNSFSIDSINDVCQGFPDVQFRETNSVVIGSSTTATLPCIPTTTASGDMALLMSASNGTVSASSAAYYINETHSTPEPATLLLFGSGLSGIVLQRRRFRLGK